MKNSILQKYSKMGRGMRYSRSISNGMNTRTITTSRLLVASMLAFSFLLSLAVIHVKAAANDSSINIKKDNSTGLFTLTIRDPDGIQEFSLSLVGRYSYGGGLSGCPRSFSSDNVSFADPSDFTPVMPAYVIDCRNNTTKLEIPPPVKGITASVAVKEEAPPPPPSTAPKEEKKAGPLSAEDIQYPVIELGNCRSEAECRSYCDNADRAKECLVFAKKYNLISAEEAKKVTDKFLNVKNGPGGCDSGPACEEYCSDVNHLDQCIAFAEETGYYSSEELAEAKKFQTLIKAGKQFPGGCKNRNACEIYCGDPNHMGECLNFAEESGFMPREEIDEARKFMALMQKGESPGGCTSKEQCENYCAEDGHVEECVAFAEKAGVMTAEEAEMVRKVGGKGPGGCHSKAQCEAYCETNSEECFRFAEEHGLINEDDLKQMREGMARFREELDKMPPEVVQCMKDAAGEENFNKMVAGEPVFDRSLEGKMKSCFSQITASFSQQFDKLPPEAAQCISDAIGEDGLRKLKSGKLDQNFNFEPLEACFQQLQGSFGGGSNFGDGGFSGPGGCKNTTECSEFCTANPQECQGFGPPGGGPPGAGGFGGGPGGGGGGGGFHNTSFSDCVSKGMSAAYVCGINGKGAPRGVETTYFNECHAKQHGTEILHEGVCEGQVPCSDVADPVCGNDNNTWISACYAKEQGGGVQYEGVCKTGGGGGGSFGGGPGGCQSQEECEAYCRAHPQECGGGGGGGGTPSLPPTSSCVPPPSGLVSWWSADLTSGATVPDITKSNNGTISGGVTVVPMEVGDAFQFDGSSGYISMGNPASLNFGTGPFSLEAWFNWNGTLGTSAKNIIRKSNYGPDPGSGYWLRVGANELEFSVGGTLGPVGQSIIMAPISAGVWHHAVAVKDSSGTVKLYVDGESRGAVLRQAPDANSTSEVPFLIGAWSQGGGASEFFNGQIDEVAVYNRALGVLEAQELFHAGSIGKCATNYGRTNRELPQDDQQQNQQSQPPANYSGPGGCKNADECRTYCTQNYQDPACQQFAPPSSSLPLSSLLGTVLGPWLQLVN